MLKIGTEKNVLHAQMENNGIKPLIHAHVLIQTGTDTDVLDV